MAVTVEQGMAVLDGVDHSSRVVEGRAVMRKQEVGKRKQ